MKAKELTKIVVEAKTTDGSSYKVQKVYLTGEEIPDDEARQAGLLPVKVSDDEEIHTAVPSEGPLTAKPPAPHTTDRPRRR